MITEQKYLFSSLQHISEPAQYYIDLCKSETRIQSNNVLSHAGIKKVLSNYSLSYCGIQMAFQDNSLDP